MNKKVNLRKMEISLFNVFLCLLVVFIHTVSKSQATLSQFPAAPLYKFFVNMNRFLTFAVQAFIFLSAMKNFLNNRRCSYGKFMLKNIKRVIIPYIAVAAIYYLYMVYILKWFDFSMRDFISYVVKGDLAAHFYFILIIIQFYLLYPIWGFILDKVHPIVGIGMAAVLTAVLGWYAPFIINDLFGIDDVPWLDRTFTMYLLYWVGGMYAGKYYDKFIGFIRRHGFGAAAAAAVLLFAVLDISIFNLYIADRARPLHLNMLHGVYSSFVICLAMYAAFRGRRLMNSFLHLIDNASYYIYLIHVLFIFIFDYSINILHFSSVTLDTVVRLLVIYGAVVIFAFAYNFAVRGRSALTGGISRGKLK